MRDLYSTTATTQVVPHTAVRWDSINWSCGYDAFLNLMWALWRERGKTWFDQISPTSSDLLRLSEQFALVETGTSSLEGIRQMIRERLSVRNPRAFPLYGHVSIAVDDVFLEFLASNASSTLLHRVSWSCTYCGCPAPEADAVTCPFIWESQAIEDSAERHAGVLSTSSIVSDIFESGLSVRCSLCRHRLQSRITFLEAPKLFIINLNRRLPVHVPFQVDPILTLPNNSGTETQMRLSGIVYWGGNHFTTQLIDSTGTLWYNDGAQPVMTSRYVSRGLLGAVSLDECEARIPRMIMYSA
ncbi:hypothetical protein BDW22DRAFT_1338755 [Trametopsis cervina]|nr:hypothetical protein BDW22DRAFT_1338755 [Trametopsis cervina]